ncbi:MAG: hypothetical protein HY049_04450 [Acidobacteria bacterium]|nr:hypothetical protein [Acidobacteriota bacterium]
MANRMMGTVTACLSAAVLAAAAGYVFGVKQTVQQSTPSVVPNELKVPPLTGPTGPTGPSSNCSGQSPHPVTGMGLPGFKLQLDGVSAPDPFKPSFNPVKLQLHHVLNVANESGTTVAVSKVGLWVGVTNGFVESDSTNAGCGYPMLTQPTCSSVANGGSCDIGFTGTGAPTTGFIEVITSSGVIIVALQF